MTASILWEPVTRGRSIDCPTPSKFRSVIEKVFNGFPIVFTRGDASTLWAMYHSTGEGHYKQIAQLVEKHDSIRIWDGH